MVSKDVELISEVGLYGRCAASFIQLANTFKSTMFIEQNGKKANAKSLLGVLSLAIASNTKVKITAEGADEKEAVDSLVDFVSSGCMPISTESKQENAVVGTVNPKESIENYSVSNDNNVGSNSSVSGSKQKNDSSPAISKGVIHENAKDRKLKT